MNVKSILSKNIKLLRKGKFTQQTLAESVGISHSAIRDYENCNSFPAPETLAAIAKALDVGVADLFKEASEEDVETIKMNSMHKSLSEVVGSFGYNLDTTNYSNMNDEKIARMQELDLEMACIESFERLVEYLESYDDLWWIDTLNDVTSSYYAAFRFIFFYEKFHRKRSMTPALDDYNFPTKYPDWLSEMYSGFEKHDFFSNKQVHKDQRADVLRRLTNYSEKNLKSLKEAIENELDKRLIENEKKRLKGKTTA